MSDAPPNLQSSVQSSSEMARREELLHLLDSEIHHDLEQRKRHGWTKWALIGALAAIIWLLLDKVEASSFGWTNALVLLLVFSVIHSAGSYFWHFFWGSKTKEHSFRYRYIERANRGIFFLATVYMVSLIHIAIRYSAGIPLHQKIAVVTFLILMAVGCLAGLVISYLRIPVAVSSGLPEGLLGRITGIIIGGFLLVVMFSTTGYLANIFSGPEGVSVEDWRVGILLFAITYIFTLFPATHDTELILSLAQLRRGIVFGTMELNTAIKQAEIVIAGMHVADVVQDELRPILKLFEEINAELNEALNKYEALTSSLPSGDEPLPADKVVLVNTVSAANELHIANADNKMSEIGSRLKKLKKRIIWIGRQTAESTRAIDDVSIKIDDAVKNSQIPLDKLRAKVKYLKKRLLSNVS
jgi:hypothetical protein